jgi:hypothetical protein
MSAITRLALRTSWAGARPERQRALVIALAAALTALLACALASASMDVQRVTERSLARSFVYATDGQEPAMERHTIFDSTIGGDQIYVYWWHLIDASSRIPGLPTHPSPGSWFVSPALRERMRKSPLLAERFPGARTIGRAGVGNASELVAHRIVGPSVHLDEALTNVVDKDNYLADPADISRLSVVRYGLALLLLPLIGLLLAAVAPTGPGIERRLALLRALGASRRFRGGVVGAGAIASAVPGASAAVAMWAIVAPRLTAVPLVGRPVLAGDLAVPVPALVAIAAGVVLLLATMALLRPSGIATNRPAEVVRRRPSTLRAAPIVSGLLMIAVGSGALGRPSDRLYVAGLVAGTVGCVVALPLVLHGAGQILANSRSTIAFLVGRRLRWNALASARTMLALGALCVAIPVATTWIATNRLRVEDRATVGTVEPVAVAGALDADELARLRESTGAVVVEVAGDPNAVPTLTSDPPLVLVANCQALGSVVEIARCAGGRFTLSAEGEQVFRRYRTRDAGAVRPLVGVTSIPPGMEVLTTLFVGSDWRTVDAVLRADAANRGQPGPAVGAVEHVLHESPLTSWIVGALLFAALASGAALLLHLVAHTTRLAATRRRLLGLGADARTVCQVSAAEAAASVGAAGIASAAIGTIGSWGYVQMNPDAELPVVAVATLLAAVLAAAVLAAGLAWLSAIGEPVPRD